AMRAGQADITVLRGQQQDAVASLDDSFQVHQYLPGGMIITIWLHTGRPHLDQAAVRQALNYAIDREGIDEALLDGHGPAVNQLLTDLYPGHLADPPQGYGYDVAKAR